MNKSIYELKLHETTKIGENNHVLRVPGGWIYGNTFVPFNDEFTRKTCSNCIHWDKYSGNKTGMGVCMKDDKNPIDTDHDANCSNFKIAI